MRCMGSRIGSLSLILLLSCLPLLSDGTKRLSKAADVLDEILSIPEGIPQSLLDKAECVLVFPSVKKFALGFGAKYGRGAMVCRSGRYFDGPWGPPAMYRLEGGSFGFQLGGSATDFILLVMNNKGAKSVISSKVKLGADAAAAAGPKGRTAAAATDVAMRAEILTYSRSRGLFAGISLEGSTLRQDKKPNKKLYGRDLEAREILLGGKISVPEAGRELITLLQKASPKNLSD